MGSSSSLPSPITDLLIKKYEYTDPGTRQDFVRKTIDLLNITFSGSGRAASVYLINDNTVRRVRNYLDDITGGLSDVAYQNYLKLADASDSSDVTNEEVVAVYNLYKANANINTTTLIDSFAFAKYYYDNAKKVFLSLLSTSSHQYLEELRSKTEHVFDGLQKKTLNDLLALDVIRSFTPLMLVGNDDTHYAKYSIPDDVNLTVDPFVLACYRGTILADTTDICTRLYQAFAKNESTYVDKMKNIFGSNPFVKPFSKPTRGGDGGSIVTVASTRSTGDCSAAQIGLYVVVAIIAILLYMCWFDLRCLAILVIVVGVGCLYLIVYEDMKRSQHY